MDTPTTVSQISAVVAVVPGSAQAVLLNPGATIADALAAAGVSADGMQVRYNGAAATLDTPVTGGQVVLSRQVKGN